MAKDCWRSNSSDQSSTWRWTSLDQSDPDCLSPDLFEHQPVVEFVPQLPADVDGGQLEEDDHPGRHGVDDEERPGLEAGGHEPVEGEDEEEAAYGEHDVGHRGEVRVDGVQVGEEIDVDEEAAEVETCRGCYEKDQVEDAEYPSVFLHGCWLLLQLITDWPVPAIYSNCCWPDGVQSALCTTLRYHPASQAVRPTNSDVILNL